MICMFREISLILRAMETEYRYYAFLSYSHRDEEWAQWLQHEFEHYHLPSNLNGREGLPEGFRPIFRDIDELSGGELKPQISQALAESANLIVVCSPNSARSRYVNGEIEEFMAIGRERGEDYSTRVFPFIVAGTPHSVARPDEECFPAALMALPTELIAGDAPRHGREQAFVKVLAGTLRSANVNFSMLWDRFERDRIEEERRKREERDRLLLVQSRYLSEKAQDLIDSGDSYLARLLAVEALPADLADPDRPYCHEAEAALRRASERRGFVLSAHERNVGAAKFSRDGKYVITVDDGGSAYVWQVATGALVSRIAGVYPSQGLDIDVKRFRLVGQSCAKDGGTCVWDIRTGKIVKAFNKRFMTAVFSDDGRYLAMYHKDGLLRIHDGSTYRLLKRIDCEEVSYLVDNVYLRFDKRNKSIIVGISYHSTCYRIYEYDLENGKCVYKYDSYWGVEGKSPGDVASSLANLKSTSGFLNGRLPCSLREANVSVSPDLRFLAYAYKSPSIKVYDIPSGRLLYTLNGHVKEIDSVDWNADSTFLVSTADNRSVIVWDLACYRAEESVPRHKELIRSLAFDETGRYVMTISHDGRYGESTVIWSAKSGLPVSDDLECGKLKKSFQSKQKRTLSEKDGVVSYDDDPDRRYSFEEEKPFGVWRILTSPNGKYVAVGNSVGVIHILDATTLSLIKDLNIIYRDEADKESVKEMLHDADLEVSDYISPIVSLDFSRDSSRIVSVWRNGSCCVWDIATGEYTKYPASDFWIDSARFSRDGAEVVFSGRDFIRYEIGLWDYVSGNVRSKTLEIGIAFPFSWDSVYEKPHVARATFSPDGKKIAVAFNNYVRYFDGRTLEELKKPNGHFTRVIDVEFTDDGRYVVTQSDDTRICIWDACNLRQIDVFSGICRDEDSWQIEYEEEVFRYIGREKVIPLFNENGPNVSRNGPNVWRSPGGRYIVGEEPVMNEDTDSVVSVLAVIDAGSGVKICSFGDIPSAITAVAFSRDESRIVAGCDDGTVRMWTLQPLQQLIDETKKRFSARPFTPEERRMYYLGE